MLFISHSTIATEVVSDILLIQKKKTEGKTFNM